MTVLVITDIPRMTELFEQFSQTRDGLVIVSEIHRGIDELERIKPGVIILQNHLSGLSADILLKHLKSRVGRRRCRFVLISSSETLDVEISAKFDGIMDPSQSDEELESVLDAFMLPAGQRAAAQTAQTGDSPAATPDSGQIFQEFAPESAAAAEAAQTAPAADDPLSTRENLPEPLTYDRPRRQKRSVISAFSQQLDTRAEDLAAPQSAPEPPPDHLREALHHRDDLLITDIEESPPPLYRRTWVQALTCVILVAVAVTTYQHRSGTSPAKPEAPPLAVVKPPPAKPQSPHSSASSTTKPLAAHGTGRPKGLPAFVPGDSLDKSYGKEHPGWERYLGQANEYRLFREKDGAIRSVQVLDRSGSGIQESFYVTILKEVAGVSAMRPVSSEIKEGYEIRRGESGGLQVVQYRDAQGGRLRGVVVIWP